MVFHLFVTCVSQKSSKNLESINDKDILQGTPEDVFIQWEEKLRKSKFDKIRAGELYKGDLWNKYLTLYDCVKVRFPESKLWIISAGQGLINHDTMIIPYAATFQDGKGISDSIFSKVNHEIVTKTGKKNILSKWWKLCQSMHGTPSISELIGQSKEEDRFLFVLGKEYLLSLMPEIQESINAVPNKEKIIIISNSRKDSHTKALGENLLYNSPDFRNLPGTNSVTINAAIALDLIKNFPLESTNWQRKTLNAYLIDRAKELDYKLLTQRQKSTDVEIKDFILEHLKDSEKSASELHRIFHGSGRACEQKRFSILYREIVEYLKQNKKRKKNLPAFSFQKRNSKLSFFLPDNDDRVDPDFDFINEKSQPFRDVYEYDTYHYELYGSLNCDGILVSKGVLETSPEKKKRAEKEGIHRFLRLPQSVPIIGDCGAFSYILEENPPYETDEILDYYEKYGFNYGVSIDHLIVPFVYTKYKYYHFSGNLLQQISEDEFNHLQKSKQLRILNYNQNLQYSLFGTESLVKEELIDENERNRRFNLTLTNGLHFIKNYSRKNYNFEPMGAVQGWDPDSYSAMANEFIKNGFKYIAIGGLVRSRNDEILAVVDAVNKIRPENVKMHIFGVGRKDLINPFISRNITSVDNAGILRQAWLNSTNNYYAKDFNNYSAIRVPIFDKKNSKEDFDVKDNLINLEKETLNKLKKYDDGEIGIDEVFETLVVYNKAMNVPDKIISTYKRTLEERPWENCECSICREIGIQVLIFRGNNRNRRRGFHNTWFFYKWLKSLE